MSAFNVTRGADGHQKAGVTGSTGQDQGSRSRPSDEKNFRLMVLWKGFVVHARFAQKLMQASE
jgi:hypothetical protein